MVRNLMMILGLSLVVAAFGCSSEDGGSTGAGGAGGEGGSGGALGACTNQADLAILCAAEFPAAAQACGTDNLGAGAEVIGACIAEDTGLSDECAVCFGATTQCTIDNCLADCAPDPLGEPCTVCRAENCDPTFNACAGEFSCDGVGGA
ncbi:MAG: hypothetical protein OEN21_16360 [Myxococcales bacterium]|nr:hypothetical protein [Myxococcales bacterium]